MKNVAKLVILLAIGILATACAGKADNDLNGQVSSATGWKYNDKKTTGFEVTVNFETETPPGMVPIEGGTFTIGEKEEYITSPRNNKDRNVSVNSFYMDKYEVSNINWREYEHWCKLVYERVAPQLVKEVHPDETVWREELAYNEPYVENYYSHPAFNFYPVVGVTWEQAMDYCAWRTDRVNEARLIARGILTGQAYSELPKVTDEDISAWEGESGSAYDSIAHGFVFNTKKYLLDVTYQPELNGRGGKNAMHDLFGNSRKVNESDGIFLTSYYRLPTEAEWEFAAYAPVAGEEGITIEGKIYPWSGYGLRSVNKKIVGQFEANFVRGKGDYMGVSGKLNDHHEITAPVNSYQPNDYGLYNMAGNVNEWVLDVFREVTFQDMSEYNSFRGNVYEDPVDNGTDDYGRTLYKFDRWGRIQMGVKIQADDVRDYMDQDKETVLLTDYLLDPTDTAAVNRLLNSGIPGAKVKTDPIDVLVPKATNTTRVYKGGSWKDRVYWLSPSTRRYLEQNKCTSTIGFRCAMSTVGSETFYDKK